VAQPFLAVLFLPLREKSILRTQPCREIQEHSQEWLCHKILYALFSSMPRSLRFCTIDLKNKLFENCSFENPPVLAFLNWHNREDQPSTLSQAFRGTNQFMTSAKQPVREPCGLTYKQLKKLSDEDVMLHIQAGHDDALAILFDRYRRLVNKSQRRPGNRWAM
jgi:hypothetical protein